MDTNKEWEAADPDPKCCPGVIRKYLSIKSTQHPSLIANVRRHLKYLGWNIEYSILNGCVFRYISPSKRVYLSLRQVCRELSDSVDDGVVRFKPASFFGDSVNNNDGIRFKASSFLGDSVNDNNGIRFKVCSQDTVTVPPQYCPEAVVFWHEHGLEKKRKSNKDMLWKAKMHLSFMGWSFWYIPKGENRRELRYTSPTGAVYISLRTACKACIDQQGLNSNGISSSASTKNEEQDSNVFKPNKKRKIRRTHVMRSSKRARTPEIFASSLSNCKPRTVYSWLIDNNGELMGAKVHYRGKNGTPLAKGQISRDGIKCDCCSNVFTPSGFEAHAGSQKHRPAANIILDEGGMSLSECKQKILGKNKKMTSSTRKQQHDSRIKYEDKSDEICSICHYGGELVLCDNCPSSFHKSCIGLTDHPKGNWFCPSCCCGICGNGKGESKFEEKIEHFIDGDDDGVRICHQCEHKFHVGCIKKNRAVNLNSCSETKWFCSKRCEVISSCLYEILDKPFPLGVDDLTWRLLKSMEVEMEMEAVVENQSKLKVALDVMHECFQPIKEALTGRDLVEDVIFNRRSDLNRLNFHGFYTVLLEKNEEVISVATVRIYEKVAEVPLVATRIKHRRLGMCRVLMNELEKLLIELGVERLVLPAVPGVLDTWTTKFGFSKMTNSERLLYLDYTFLDFQDTTMCHKPLRKVPLSKVELLLPWK